MSVLFLSEEREGERELRAETRESGRPVYERDCVCTQ